MAKFSKVLVVILNYMTYQLTLDTIDMLRSVLTYPVYDILVIDNCSPNESHDVLLRESKEKNYIYIYNHRNAGYASGNNTGLRYAFRNEYRYSWVINNDIHILSKDALEKLVTTMESRANVATVSPKIIDKDGNEVYQYYFRPTAFDMSFGIIRSKRKRKKMNGLISQEVYRPQGCSMLLRNSALEEIDYMDEETFLYCEEAILAERLTKKGYKSYYCADACIIHYESTTVKRLSKKIDRIKLIATSENIYMKKYRGWSVLSRMMCLFIRSFVIICRG
ncbi:MAG: glycosyltransferase family 2 protein [Aminipila sp.]